MSNTVTVIIGSEPAIVVSWVSGMNAQQALEGAYNTGGNQIVYGLQYFGSQFGYLVSMLNETYETQVATYDHHQNPSKR